jgi:hypothetical protein
MTVTFFRIKTGCVNTFYNSGIKSRVLDPYHLPVHIIPQFQKTQFFKATIIKFLRPSGDFYNKGARSRFKIFALRFHHVTVNSFSHLKTDIINRYGIHAKEVKQNASLFRKMF